MELDRLEPVTWFDIREPRYHDKTVLLKASKVNASKLKYFKITFSAPSMDGEWVVEASLVKKCPKESNGVIQCFVVPLSSLKPLTRSKQSKYEL